MKTVTHSCFSHLGTYFSPLALSEADLIQQVHCSGGHHLYLFVLVGEGESLDGGLDSSTVHTA